MEPTQHLLYIVRVAYKERFDMILSYPKMKRGTERQEESCWKPTYGLITRRNRNSRDDLLVSFVLHQRAGMYASID